jgi:hypothetical protein
MISTRQRYLFLLLLFKIVQEILVNAVKQGKVTKGIQLERKKESHQHLLMT